jgi:hypothetical protein
MSRAAVTIDVDSLRHYHAIHGLPERPDDEDPIYTIAMPRFWELLQDVGIPATLFLIGEDAPAYASVFAPVLDSGCEVASHSYAHDYRLTERSRESIRQDLGRADEVLRPLNGLRPLKGFRAPGYNINEDVFHCIDELDYTYDSSILPSPLYFGARWSIIKMYAAMGRQSRSMPGQWRQFTRPLAPYKTTPDRPFVKSRTGHLVELPIACMPKIRIPLIGTSLALLPERIQALTLQWSIQRLSFFNFEMHAIDLLDESDHPAIAAIGAHQRDVRISASRKMRQHRRLFEMLKSQLDVCTLSQVAEKVMENGIVAG